MRELPILSPDCCMSPPSERFTKKVPNVGVCNKKFHNKKFFWNQFHSREFADELCGGNHVAGSKRNSSGLGYRVQCSRLMALRMLREEAARRLEHEPRGTVVNVLLKFRPLFPMPHMPLELPRFHGS